MPTHQADDIADRVKTNRRLRNLSQEELADLSGLSIRTIQRLEKGETIGSSYTLRTVATALQITPEELTAAPLLHGGRHSASLKYMLILNWSALIGLVIPLTNIILPAIMLWRHRHNPQLKLRGQQIVSFQIIWLLITLALMIVIPSILMGFSMLVGGPLPLFIPVYVVCLVVNIYFIFRISLHLSNPTPFLEKLPNLL